MSTLPGKVQSGVGAAAAVTAGSAAGASGSAAIDGEATRARPDKDRVGRNRLAGMFEPQCGGGENGERRGANTNLAAVLSLCVDARRCRRNVMEPLVQSV